MSYEKYSRVVLPTPDTVFCRGTYIFAHPPRKKGDDKRTLVVLPKRYFDIMRKRDFTRVAGHTSELTDLFRKHTDDLLKFIAEKGVRFEGVTEFDNGVSVQFIDPQYNNLQNLVEMAAEELSLDPNEEKEDRRLLEVQATLDVSQAELTLNGISYRTPTYHDLNPDEATNQLITELSNIAEPDEFNEFMDARAVERPEGWDDAERQLDEDMPDPVHYIPVEAYQKIMGSDPIPNQFLVLTQFKDKAGKDKDIVAYRMRYKSERFEKVDLQGCMQAISHIWKPRHPLHIRQVLALDILLDPEVKIAYVFGDKQTGKTSVVMSAFESYVFGRGIGPYGKGAAEEHITLIKSGLPKNVRRLDDLLTANSSFVRAFSEQEIGIAPFTEMLKTYIERGDKYKTGIPDAAGSNKHRDLVQLPAKAPFVLLAPGDEQGMSFTGYTIRDEAQNEYPHLIEEFMSRRGPGANIAVMGDLYSQFIRPGVDVNWNGLLYSMARNIGKPHVAGIELTECWAARD